VRFFMFFIFQFAMGFSVSNDFSFASTSLQRYPFRDYVPLLKHFEFQKSMHIHTKVVGKTEFGLITSFATTDSSKKSNCNVRLEFNHNSKVNIISKSAYKNSEFITANSIFCQKVV
jgi:hypothetical protein